MLEAENARLHQRLEALVAENARLKGEDAQARKRGDTPPKPPRAKPQRGHGPTATVFHRILTSRSCATAKTVLGDSAGVVLVAGYAAYQTATKAGADGPAPAFCWAHVRRKFYEARQFAPACEEVLKRIGQLYAIEADPPGWHALAGEGRPWAAPLVRLRRASRERSRLLQPCCKPPRRRAPRRAMPRRFPRACRDLRRCRAGLRKLPRPSVEESTSPRPPAREPVAGPVGEGSVVVQAIHGFLHPGVV